MAALAGASAGEPDAGRRVLLAMNGISSGGSENVGT
jgi:hypothetical protein